MIVARGVADDDWAARRPEPDRVVSLPRSHTAQRFSFLV